MDVNEQTDFIIKNLDLPVPINAAVFGVKVLLHAPSQNFQLLLTNLSADANPISLAALLESLPKISVPTTFKDILNQSVIFLKNSHDCIQYTADSLIFLSNAFPDLDSEFIFSTFKSFNSDLYNTCVYLNQKFTHTQYDPDSEIYKIFNPYAAHQISKLLALDEQSKITINDNKTNNIQNKTEKNQFQEKEDESSTSNLLLQIEKEKQISDKHQQVKKEDDENCAQKLHEKIEEKRKEETNQFECCCCFESFPLTEMVHCPKGHLICRRCIEMTIEMSLDEGKVRTDCPSTDGCNTKISNSELKRILPENLYQKLKETELLNRKNKK